MILLVVVDIYLEFFHDCIMWINVMYTFQIFFFPLLICGIYFLCQGQARASSSPPASSRGASSSSPARPMFAFASSPAQEESLGDVSLELFPSPRSKDRPPHPLEPQVIITEGEKSLGENDSVVKGSTKKKSGPKGNGHRKPDALPSDESIEKDHGAKGGTKVLKSSSRNSKKKNKLSVTRSSVTPQSSVSKDSSSLPLEGPLLTPSMEAPSVIPMTPTPTVSAAEGQGTRPSPRKSQDSPRPARPKTRSGKGKTSAAPDHPKSKDPSNIQESAAPPVQDPGIGETLKFILEEMRAMRSRMSEVERIQQSQQGQSTLPVSVPHSGGAAPASESHLPEDQSEQQEHLVVHLEDAPEDAAQEEQHVVFQSPVVERLPLDQIPQGWQVLKDGMSLGRQPGSLVFGDGTLYGPQSVDVDTEAYERPIWRFRTREGTSKPPKGLIPVRQAYESLMDVLAAEPASVREWHDTPFHPPGSSSDRAVVVNLDDDAVLASFLSSVPEWFSEIAKGSKVSWGEAASPANLIPDHISAIGCKEFVETFSRKKFEASEPGSLFNSDRAPKLTDAALTDEHGARLNFLSCLNAAIMAESIARQFPKDDPASAPHFAMLKMTLQPLWTSFVLFAQKKLELRKMALKPCFKESTLVVKLLSSNPLTPDLFDKEAFNYVTAQADRQASSILNLLGFRNQPQKRPAASQPPVTPKRQRQQGPLTPQRQQSPGTPGRGQITNYQNRSNYYSPSRTYYAPGGRNPPYVPRGRGYRSPRNRGGRTPGPSLRGQRGQGRGSNF